MNLLIGNIYIQLEMILKVILFIIYLVNSCKSTRLLDGNFSIIFSRDHTSESVQRKIVSALGTKAIALEGEYKIFRKGNVISDFANAYIEVTYQPGIYQAIKKYHPDVIIGEGFFQWTAPAIAYRILHGTPLVISYERTHHTERNSQWFRTLYRKKVIRLVDAMCCNGRLSAAYSHWLGMPEARIVTGSMAADAEILQQKCKEMSLEKRREFKRLLNIDSPVFLYVGQLVERKGVRQLLESWARLRVENGGFLVIVGDGPERSVLEAFVKNRGLTTVRFIGGVAYDSIAQYYAMADVFVMPTLEDNWSLVVPEAMACGLPILCSIYNGCWPELIKNDINGYTFDPYNAEEISTKLKLFIDDQESACRMGKASKQIVADFSPANAAKAMFQACQIAYQNRGLIR